MDSSDRPRPPQAKVYAPAPQLTPIRPDHRKAEIVKALNVLRVDANHVLELRAPEVPRRYGKAGSVAGWFDDMTKLADAAVRLEDQGAAGIYVTLNPCNPALLARACNRVVEFPKATTADHDIARRVWLPLDIDPVRPAGISSSPAELEAARLRGVEVAAWLQQKLQADPTIWACSGNGHHLLYRVDLPNDDNATTWVKGLINQAADLFSDDQVSIDRTVFNAARIWKLYGTLARKGDEVQRLGRVHRRAHILSEGFQ